MDYISMVIMISLLLAFATPLQQQQQPTIPNAETFKPPAGTLESTTHGTSFQSPPGTPSTTAETTTVPMTGNTQPHSQIRLSSQNTFANRGLHAMQYRHPMNKYAYYRQRSRYPQSSSKYYQHPYYSKYYQQPKYQKYQKYQKYPNYSQKSPYYRHPYYPKYPPHYPVRRAQNHPSIAPVVSSETPVAAQMPAHHSTNTNSAPSSAEVSPMGNRFPSTASASMEISGPLTMRPNGFSGFPTN
eukprot:NODE_430_length_7576_cov_0.738665.p2 type:complete len:242 gc:universal NODE_430_length_7576_cov_0.738665:2015-1290(-)